MLSDACGPRLQQTLRNRSQSAAANLIVSTGNPADRAAFAAPTTPRCGCRYTPGMLDREACERRVYRLATLLTGNPNAATRVIEQVVDAQPDLRDLDSAHMDRLTVLRSREIATATLVHELVPAPIAEGMASLSPQQREAWVFANVYRVPEREIARAMDCSVTATQRHLELARSAFAARLKPGDADPAATLLRYSMSIDVPRFYHMQRQRRRHWRVAIIIIGGIAAALIIGAAFAWWARPLDGR